MPLADGFDEIEAFTLSGLLRRSGIDVKQVGLQGVILTGSDGTKIVTEGKLDDMDSSSFDGILLVGGSHCDKFSRSSKIVDIIKKFNSTGKYIAAIDEAPCILVQAGILHDKKATVRPGMERKLSRPRSEPVVTDGNIITAQGPAASVQLGFSIIEKMVSPNRVNFAKEVLAGKEDRV